MVKPLLEIDRVTIQVGSKTLLEEVSLVVHPGEVIGLLGPNGAGKSTLIRIAAGLLTPTRGHVLLSGLDPSGCSRREIARQAAWIPQDAPVDFDFQVRDLVTLGRYPHRGRLSPLRPQDRQIVEKALEQVDALHLANRRTSTLSGGERRRIVFARALAQETPLLLLDEPTSGLDLAHRARILDLIDSAARGPGGALLALHAIEEAHAVCDRVFLLDRGRTAATGPPDQILTPEMIESVYGAPPAAVQQRRRTNPDKPS